MHSPDQPFLDQQNSYVRETRRMRTMTVLWPLRGITINYHCNYLGIKALRLPLPLRISTKENISTDIHNIHHSSCMVIV